MAQVTKRYLFDGASITMFGNQILEQVDVFMVEGFEPVSASGELEGQGLYNAIMAGLTISDFTSTRPEWNPDTNTADQSRLPPLWSQHPWNTLCEPLRWLYAVSRDVKVQGTKAIVAVRYVNVLGQLRYRGGSGFTLIDSTLDREGKPVYVWNPDWLTNEKLINEGKDATEYENAPPRQIARYSIPVVEQTFMVERIRPSILFFNGIDPIRLGAAYVGKLNKQRFVVGGFAYPKGTVICENFSYDNDEYGNVAWRTVAEFRYRPVRYGFQPQVYHVNDVTGLPSEGCEKFKAPDFDKNIPTAEKDERYSLKVVRGFDYADIQDLIFAPV